MTPDLSRGERFPDIELPDHSGNIRRLSELVGGDPAFVNFFRGFWFGAEVTLIEGGAHLMSREPGRSASSC